MHSINLPTRKALLRLMMKAFDMVRRNDFAKIGCIVVVAVCCALPFLNKAMHIDDPLFLWTAEQIQKHPGDFYGFSVNWYSGEIPMSQVTKNPPLVSYYIAAAAAVGGWSEPVLHAAFLLITIGTALGMYALAKLFCAHPLEAVLVGMLTPVFLLSSTTIMCDVMMVGCWVWSVALWVHGLRRPNTFERVLAAVLIAVCALTKYFGMALLPLLACYTIAAERRLTKSLLPLIIPVMLLGGYQWLTSALYGRGLLLDAAAYATDFRALRGEHLSSVLFTGMAFAGGCYITMLLYTFRLWPRRGIMIGAVIAALVFLLLSSFNTIGQFTLPENTGERMGFVAQAALMIVAGIGLIVLAITDYLDRRDAGSLLLVLWSLGTLVFATAINWSINGRSLLPMAPVFGMIIVRRMEGFGSGDRRSTMWYTLWPLVLAACISLLVSYADASLANTVRTEATTVSATYRQHTLWFQGHWGFQYYMESSGGRPIDYSRSRFSTGDIIVTPLNNTGVQRIPRNIGTLIDTMEFAPFPWLTTMNLYAGAGFYADVWGPLPYVFGPVPAEKCFILQVGEPRTP